MFQLWAPKKFWVEKRDDQSSVMGAVVVEVDSVEVLGAYVRPVRSGEVDV